MDFSFFTLYRKGKKKAARKAAAHKGARKAKRSRKEDPQPAEEEEEEVPAARPTTGGKCPKSSISVHELKKMNQASVECLFPPVQQPCHWVTDDETVPPSIPLSQATTSRKRKVTSPCRSPAASSPAATEAATVAAPVTTAQGWVISTHTPTKAPRTPPKGWIVSPRKTLGENKSPKKRRKLAPLMAQAARAATHEAAQYGMAGRGLLRPRTPSPK